jgi:hypothetical protein
MLDVLIITLRLFLFVFCYFSSLSPFCARVSLTVYIPVRLLFVKCVTLTFLSCSFLHLFLACLWTFLSAPTCSLSPFFPHSFQKPFFVYFFGGLECVGHSFAYVAYFVFLRDVWIRTQRAAVASRRATNLAINLPN